MLVINYNGNKPITDYYKFSVQGNNLADKIRFLISLNQSGLVFDENYHYYAKVQCVDDDFYDKVELSEITFDDVKNLLLLDFALESKHTCHKSIEVAVSCENLDSEVVWQTQIVKVAIPNGISADEEIENDYPTILAQLQAQIDELSKKEGGGSNSVEIEKIWLTYDDNEVILTDYLGVIGGVATQKPFVNDSTRIWFNFKTTPISTAIENEIKKGRFIIRLDYPTRSRNKHLVGGEGGFSFRHLQKNDYGIGCRSYRHNFLADAQGDINEERIEILKNSLIFVNESDIKTNRYGEKYIHTKIALFDYIQNICKIVDNTLYPITNEAIQDGQPLSELFNICLDGHFCIGIPNLNENCDNYPNKYTGTFRYNCFSSDRGRGGTIPNLGSKDPKSPKINGKKLNYAFSCYTPLYTIGNTTGKLVLKSPYATNSTKKAIYYIRKIYTSGEGLSRYFTIGKQDDTKSGNIKQQYIVARPRCAILSDNWETDEYAFLKKFPQSKQQIKLFCRAIVYVDDYGVNSIPIFRTKITDR